MKRKVYCWFFASVLVMALAGAAIGAPKSLATVAEIALYQGADRQQMLEAGAKKEGKLIFYTTGVMAGSLGPFLDMFKKKYPYIKVDLWRANTPDLTARILEEYSAKRYSVDVIEATQDGHLTFQERGIVQPFFSPDLAYIDEGGITKAPGGGALSAAFRLHGIGLGFNTNLMSRKDAPKTYQQLLDPKWKGKLALPGGGVPVTWMGTLLKTYGLEFVEKMAQQNFVIHTMAARGLLDLIIAGEYPASPAIFDSHVTTSRKKGAPVDWLPLEPVPVNVTQVALPKFSSHPHAAMLLLDFKFSKEAAEIEKVYGYLPTRKDVPVEGSYKKYYGAESLVEVMQLQRTYGRIFLKQ